jgi:DMSO/TMAO reductase YedYZ molybdopterin-dependent catalytic subunit
LLVEHGFPLRLYVPNVYGMKQPKWITAIDLLDHFEAGYWVSRGWDRDGVMRATSVVDAVDVTGTATTAGGQSRALIGGIAHAGSRAIARVEVRVDEGEWHEARVREPLSSTTWVVWRVEVPYAPGEYTLTVRCVESDGVAQAGRLHSKHVRLA